MIVKNEIMRIVIGLILLICGFLSFVSIALLNFGEGIASNTHWFIVGTGLILIFISIIVFYTVVDHP